MLLKIKDCLKKDEITSEELNPTVLVFADSNQNAEDLVLYKTNYSYKGFLTSKEYKLPKEISFGENTTFDIVISKLNSLGDFSFYLKDQKQ